MNRDDLPYRAMRALGKVVRETAVEVADDAVDRHVEAYHRDDTPLIIPPRPPLKAVPFHAESIPGEDLERMVEVLETEPEADVHQVAQRFGYPVSLVVRELADHQSNFGRFIFMRARM